MRYLGFRGDLTLAYPGYNMCPKKFQVDEWLFILGPRAQDCDQNKGLKDWRNPKFFCLHVSLPLRVRLPGPSPSPHSDGCHVGPVATNYSLSRTKRWETIVKPLNLWSSIYLDITIDSVWHARSVNLYTQTNTMLIEIICLSRAHTLSALIGTYWHSGTEVRRSGQTWPTLCKVHAPATGPATSCFFNEMSIFMPLAQKEGRSARMQLGKCQFLGDTQRQSCSAVPRETNYCMHFKNTDSIWQFYLINSILKWGVFCSTLRTSI